MDSDVIIIFFGITGDRLTFVRTVQRLLVSGITTCGTPFLFFLWPEKKSNSSCPCRYHRVAHDLHFEESAGALIPVPRKNCGWKLHCKSLTPRSATITKENCRKSHIDKMLRSFALLVVGVIIQFRGTIAAAKIPRPSLSQSPEHKRVTEPLGYEILDEKVAYHRWRSIVQRSVRMPNGNLVDFDIVGQKAGAGASIVFAWNSKSKTCTLVKEYNPGCHKILAGLAAGLVEDDKHGDCFATAAEHELEEECHLSGENSEWHLLTNQPIAMDKYASTLIAPFLVLDPEHVENPKPLDDEEDIEIVRDVPIEEVVRMIREGEMNVIGSWASLLAIEKLRELGEIP